MDGPNSTYRLLNGLEFLYPKNITISQLKRTLYDFPKSESGFSDAFSKGQLSSKMWLIENLPDDLGMVFICAGWYGTLAHLMFLNARDKFDKIRSFDIDPDCASIAESYNQHSVSSGWQFKASTLDILDITYPTKHKTLKSDGNYISLIEIPDTIINTSCEHIANMDWFNSIPSDTLVVLQSNDFLGATGHVNCHETLEQFEKQTPLKEVHFSGSLQCTGPIHNPTYNRFMRIGWV